MIAFEEQVAAILSVLRPQRVLEIGTLHGVSAAFFARHCDTAVTVDIEHHAAAPALWAELGVASRIAAVLVADDAAKARLIAALDFDLAFVDGAHTGEGVAFDVACTRKGRAVLFHDYKPTGGIYAACTNRRMPELAAVIDRLEPAPVMFGPLCSRMALWLNPASTTATDRAAVELALAAMPTIVRAKTPVTGPERVGREVAEAVCGPIGRGRGGRLLLPSGGSTGRGLGLRSLHSRQ